MSAAALVALAPNAAVSNVGLQPSARGFADLSRSELDARQGNNVSIATPRGPVSALLDGVIDDEIVSLAGLELIFDNVLAYAVTTQDGDSGAAVLDENGYVLGIHFARSRNSRFGYCITARRILKVFETRRLTLLA